MPKQQPKSEVTTQQSDSPRSMQFQTMTEARLQRSIRRSHKIALLSVFAGILGIVLWAVIVFTNLLSSPLLHDHYLVPLVLGITYLINASFYLRKKRRTENSMHRWKDNLPRR